MQEEVSSSANISELLESFANTWKVLRKYLSNYVVDGRILVKPELTRMDVTPQTPLAMLLPSEKFGCALAMVHFLCAQQNEFLEFFVANTGKRLRDDKPVSSASSCHLIDVDPALDLFPLLVSHQSYSVDTILQSDYDFFSLQERIIERFVAGRSRLDWKVNTVVFVDDYASADLLTQLKSMIPQVKLTPQTTDNLLLTQWELPTLCTLLGQLDIAMAFLISIGGEEDTQLTDFLMNTLQINYKPCNSTVDQCQLKHVEQLWRLLSMQKAYLITTLKQDPFLNLPQDFKEDMSQELHESMDSFLQTKQRRPWEVAEMLFNYMLDILIPQSKDNEGGDLKQWPLHDCLEPLKAENYNSIVDDFPKLLLNKHFAAAWNSVVDIILRMPHQHPQF